jgi:hypothetical protein
MDESIGRETLQELITLQLSLLKTYKEVLDSQELRDAKQALNNAIKAAIAAVGPVLTLQHMAAGKAVGLHREAVDQTRTLLEKLLREEQARAALHQKLHEEAEGRRAEAERRRTAERGGQAP